MEVNLKLKLLNVFGGDGVTRPYEVRETKLSRSRTRTRTRQDLGIPIESSMDETAEEVKQDVCQTFNKDNGTPVLRLGGSHGKLWGTLKEIGEMLKDSTGEFKSYAEITRLMKSIRIVPVYVKLENAGEPVVESLPQILHGVRSSMITQHFDVIPECIAQLKVIFPDVMEPKVKMLFDHISEISALNKRRATILLEEWE